MDQSLIEKDVRHSQEIERISYDIESKLTQAHIAMTKFVVDEVVDGHLPDVRQLHAGLMRPSGLDLPSIGLWRTWDVYAGPGAQKREKRAQKPRSSHIDMMMTEWYNACRFFLEEDLAVDIHDTVNICDKLYYHFECIHPFADGNGRTGRLMRNALRILKGLPWHTIPVSQHDWYVAALQEYEELEFKPTYSMFY